MSYSVYLVKNRAGFFLDFEHPTFQGVITFRHVNPGCRFACPGLWAPLGLQPALAKSGTQGVASLALGYVLHWAFSPSLLNPELECNTTMSVKVGAWHNAHTLHPVLTQKRHSRCTCPTKLGESAVWMPFFWYFLPWCNKNTRNCNICDSTFGHSLRTFASWKWGK